MDKDEKHPYFHALAVFACKRNRLYRVYVLPNELIFIWAGSGSEGLQGMRAVERKSFWLEDSMIAKALIPFLDPSRKNNARLAELNRTPLEQLINDNPKNLRAPVSGFTEVRIGKRSDRHARTYSDHTHQALLYLRHRDLGKYRLGIATAKDVRTAMHVLPQATGPVYAAEIKPPMQDEQCGCVFCDGNSF